MVNGLDSGADDYLSKSFHPDELKARIRVAQRLYRAYRDSQRNGQKFLETRDRLAHAEKLSALGQLLAQIAHEINNPINVILNNVPPMREDLTTLQEVLEAYRQASAGLADGGAELEKRWQQQSVDTIDDRL